MGRQGVILAGGLASRLGPITRVLNKHLLPVGSKPMIFHGLELMNKIGVTDLVIVLGGNSVGDIVNLVGDGKEFGLDVTYRYQYKPTGIADALLLAKPVLRNEPFIVLLGDNVFDGTLDYSRIDFWFLDGMRKPFIITKEVPNPHEYGQPVYRDGKIIKFVEKDTTVNHNRIVTGLYGFNYTVFSLIKGQKYSERGEREITDTLSQYIPRIDEFVYEGFWVDCGTNHGLYVANSHYREEK